MHVLKFGYPKKINMSQIAIIDDNPEQSGTLKKFLQHYLNRFGSDLIVIDQYPFANIELYFDFIHENDVCVLILDEKLNDQATPEGGPVSYKGNELVSELRKKLKDFPIFMVTTFSTEAELVAKTSEFEYILSRAEITQDDDGYKYVPIIIRSAQRYLDSNNEELSEFNKLTKRVAAGDRDPEIVKRLEALQVKLELPSTGFDDRKIWLDEYEDHIKELEVLKNDLQKKLNEK